MTWESRYRTTIAGLGAACADLRVRWMVIGGIAVIARGVIRTTEDVDATLWAPGLEIEKVLSACRAHQIVGRVDDVRQLAARAQIVLLRHEVTNIDLDVSLCWLPFEDEALDRARPVDFGEGVTVPVAQPDDLVIYKTVAWRDQDRQDIERLLQRHGSTIDLSRVRAHIEMLAQLAEMPERARQFEELVERLNRHGRGN